MGNLLRLLSRDETPKYDVFVDFENARPTDTEKEVYILVECVLIEANDILSALQTYKGAGTEIREAIGNPLNEEQQIKAWDAVLPLVNKLKHFYQFSLKLEDCVPKVLSALCSGSMSPRQHLETQQALVKQFAEILDFVLKFDDLKMTNPSIQNDFSYYRRTVNRLRIANQDNPIFAENNVNISNEVANRMSLFYAQPTPMLKVLSDSTSHFVVNNKELPIENTTETLGTMAKVCQRMIENHEFYSRFQKEDTILFVLRVMVGVIILYDHVHPVGAFVKSSHIDVRGSIKVLKEQPPNVVEGLLNALRYTTRHLNDVTTPKNIKNLLT
ncbi:CYFIP-related Rac1 interactor B-like [Oppia nitens]|uniref:CYFIP-related Rac1 interactor B-like n=1 Tax=Oppia nitens TaxID=1686743 RepID=UPI0023DBE4AF|nr:CYFIP-related Rac1 interactor B-like [Oppia nitens]XP_054169052.1 CYFIP-related Rac1 interactor B-like [Oppia nitens]XP_054169053.1 CYFIP-related Rac1 interactor B-like [Oppia nitens]XP_054169054.1 CYFIP-related Rac1 interactor B-like [Oppia nitens]XP_054169055.1 CYFIP-related Rac1 interactor B-like [Oppia nitens]